MVSGSGGNFLTIPRGCKGKFGGAAGEGAGERKKWLGWGF